MTTVNFTNSSGLALQFTNHDLDLVLTELTTGNTYYSVGNNDLVYIMLGNGYLLVMDISNTINRKLFECYHFSASNLYPFQLKLTHDYTITFWFNRNNFVITKIHSLGIILGYILWDLFWVVMIGYY